MSEEPVLDTNEPNGASNGVPVEAEPDPGTFRFQARPASYNTPYLVPELPPYFVPRTEFFALKRQFLENAGGLPYPLLLHGPGGAGKTSLAAALAHDADIMRSFSDGVLWASLGEGDDPQRAQRTWGQALGNDLNNLPDTTSRAALLRKMIGDGRYLLIIDNATNPGQIKALNVAGPRCIRLITTDNPDSISAVKSRRYSVSKMREDESLQLLEEWAGILPDIYKPTVKEIVMRLTGLPLALALVGGQARQGITWLRLLEVLREDQGPVAMLKAEDLAVRINALGLVLNIVLSRFAGSQLNRTGLLAAFAPGTGTPFSIEAAAAAWDVPAEEASRTLDVLVEAAVVHRTPGRQYAVHPALREHLAKRVHDRELKAAVMRVRSHYLTLIESTLAPVQQVDTQIGQIMAAYRRTLQEDTATATIFTDALMGFFERRGLWSNFVGLIAEAIESARQQNDIMREYLYLSDLGYAQTVMGDTPGARAAFEKSLEISERLGDPAGEANALNNLGALHEREAEFERAEEFYRRSLAIREDLGMRDEIAITLNNIAGVQYWQERWDESLISFQRVLDMYLVLNDREGQAQTWLNIGAVYESMGDDVDALNAYQRSLAIYANLNDEPGESQALNNIGIVYLNREETDRALDHFKRSLAIKERLNDEQGLATTVNNIAMLYERTGSPVLALEHYERSYRLLRSLNDVRAEVVLENIQSLQEQMKGE